MARMVRDREKLREHDLGVGILHATECWPYYCLGRVPALAVLGCTASEPGSRRRVSLTCLTMGRVHGHDQLQLPSSSFRP